MNPTMIGYISKHGHYDKFVALACLWNQAYPQVGIGKHCDALARRFNQFIESQPPGIYLHDNYALCAMFVETEHVRIYGGLSVARIGVAY